MKYKTLFRLALKVIGVYMVATGIPSFLGVIMGVLAVLGGYDNGNFTYPLFFWIPSSGIFPILIGLYLFFKGEWIVNKAIPSNRPYCHECGYELTHATSNTCPECGTEFKKPD
jgi:hypothetical protein